MLLNLCHHANAEGEAFPSVATVAKETGYSPKAVITALEGLRSLGIVTRAGRCGQRNRVGVYSVCGVLTSVHNLANGEVTTPLKPPNGEVSSAEGAPNGELTSANGEVNSHRSILGNKKSVSKLVSEGANGEVTSTFVHNSGGGPTFAPSARNEGTPAASSDEEYAAKVRTPGWKPKTDLDRRYCAALCFTLGANRDQAQRFVRFNAIRRWTCCEYGTVNDAAKQWVEKWQEDEPEAYWAERKRRKAARQ